MSMAVGGSGSTKSDINMTPMIDVLLVLIIIFMLITPTTSRGLEALVPQPSDSSTPSRSEVVITVRADGTVQFNQESMDLRMLESRLSRLFRPGRNCLLYTSPSPRD